MLGHELVVFVGFIAVDFVTLEIDDTNIALVEVGGVVAIDEAHVVDVERIGTVEDEIDIGRIL